MAGKSVLPTEAGIATAVLASDFSDPEAAVFAIALLELSDEIRVLDATATPAGDARKAYSIHFTTDGSLPTAASPKLSQPIKKGTPLRVALVSEGVVVARASMAAGSNKEITTGTATAMRE
jgi:hypothetical protein